jgi:hypothetical protein
MRSGSAGGGEGRFVGVCCLERERGDERLQEGCRYRCVYIVVVAMFSTQLPLTHLRFYIICLDFGHWKA